MNRGDREVLEETCLDSMYSVSKKHSWRGKQNDLYAMDWMDGLDFEESNQEPW